MVIMRTFLDRVYGIDYFILLFQPLLRKVTINFCYHLLLYMLSNFVLHSV